METAMTASAPTDPATELDLTLFRRSLGTDNAAGIPEKLPRPKRCPQLEDTLFAILPFAHIRKDDREKKEVLARAAAESADRLRQCVKETEIFFRALVTCAIEVRDCKSPTERLRLKQLKEKELLADMPRLRPPLFMPILLHIMANGKPSTVEMYYDIGLKFAIGELIQDILDGLERLVSTQLVGKIKWYSPQVCEYDFYRAVVVQSLGESSTTRREEGSKVIDTTTRTVTDNHRVAIHSHEVINAKKLALPAEKILRPQSVSTLIESIPIWLKHSVRVVAGDQIRETIVERELRTVSREDRSERVVATRSEDTIYRWDPALVLGPYVLAGWTDADVAAEPTKTDPNSPPHSGFDLATKNAVRNAAIVLTVVAVAVAAILVAPFVVAAVHAVVEFLITVLKCLGILALIGIGIYVFANSQSS
jgi:hypothetical protein